MRNDRFVCFARTRASWVHKLPESSSGKSTAAAIREWIQFALILFGSGWAIYTFIFKEIWEPQAAPVNISMELGLQAVGKSESDAGGSKQTLLAVELKASARNPSSRLVYLLDNVWTAYGKKIVATNLEENALFEIANHEFDVRNDTTPILARHFSTYGQSSLVATGRLFADDILNPGEMISRTVVFYVPLGDYDLITVQAQIPSSDRDVAIVKWSIDSGGATAHVLRKNPDGEPEAVALDSEGNLPADISIQTYYASAATSLWPQQ